MSTLKNPTFTFDLTQIQVVSFQHVTASIWILCNILKNIPHALDVHAQRVLKYNFILNYDCTIIETGRFNVFLQTGSVVTVQSQSERDTIKIKFLVFCLKGVIPLKNSP
jgi:hypothetical protein